MRHLTTCMQKIEVGNRFGPRMGLIPRAYGQSTGCISVARGQATAMDGGRYEPMDGRGRVESGTKTEGNAGAISEMAGATG
jgi:hypothetical protein